MTRGVGGMAPNRLKSTVNGPLRKIFQIQPHVSAYERFTKFSNTFQFGSFTINVNHWLGECQHKVDLLYKKSIENGWQGGVVVEWLQIGWSQLWMVL